MRRDVSALITGSVTEPAELVFSIAVSALSNITEENLSITVDGTPVDVREVADSCGTRLHVVNAPVGELRVEYSASVTGRAEPVAVEASDAIRYLRPSRYAESDMLAPTAGSEFGGVTDAKELLLKVSSWVGTQLAYVSGSSLPTDGAVRTLLQRQGVCRDFAHLTVALLRASGVPARLVAVYAPGLAPMDFHAVAEALVDGQWRVVDATTLAPRETLLRISTGRDASDTAFLTVQSGRFALGTVEVTATADVLPGDDLDQFVSLG